MRKFIKLIIKAFLLLLFVAIAINIYMIISVKDQIISISDISNDKYDCILILGAGIRRNKPSPMLEDRLTTGIEVYNKTPTNKIIVSGDHTKEDYNEVVVMKNYLLEHDIPEENIFMDHAGISSYDSIYRANKIYKANKIIIVTQKYHLYRSLYIANKLGFDEVYGIASDKKVYVNQSKRDIREFFARIKDFFKCIIKPSSTYLGETYHISGDGTKTDDTIAN